MRKHALLHAFCGELRLTPWLVKGALLISLAPAAAHDSWISREHRTDPITGRWCCNEHDCKVVPEEQERIQSAPGGYTVDGEFVPAERVQHSPDGQFWVCKLFDPAAKNKIRCFFVPQPSA